VDTLQPPAIRNRAGLARVVAITNQKGGTGKTTTTVNLGAFFAALLGYRVLLVDADSAATLSKTFLEQNPNKLPMSLADLIMQALSPDYTPDTALPTAEAILNVRPNLDLLPTNIQLARCEMEIAQKSAQWILNDVLAPVRASYDLIFVDTVPSLNPLHITAICAADDVLIPLTPTYYDEWGLNDLINSILRVRRDNAGLTITGVILNRVDPRTNLTQEVREDLTHHRLKIIGTIRQAASVAKAPGYKQTIFEFDSAHKAADDYRLLGATLMNEWSARAAAAPRREVGHV
jgi:chromosome partitioning protein